MTDPETDAPSWEAEPTRLQHGGTRNPTRRQGEAGHTRLQGGADRTRMQGGPGETRLQGTRQPDPTRLQGADARRAHADSGNGAAIPGLTERYELLTVLGGGGEADVWLARPRGEDLPEQVAVKIYRPGFAVNVELVSRLDDERFHRHVPRLFEYGNTEDATGQPRGWEVMEYFPEGSLQTLLAREAVAGGGLPPDRVRAVLVELIRAIGFWETTVKARQVDLSPGNILVRRSRPEPELVISDFGGVVGTGPSQRRGDVLGKLRYLAPAAAFTRTRSEENIWWSVGMIVHELLTGTLPGALGGEDLHEDTLRELLSEVDPEVNLPDPRWQLLVTGLLTRDPRHRWKGAQIGEWLGGGSPAVHRSEHPGTSNVPPINYLGEQFRSPAVLAARLADDGDRAAEWLAAQGASNLLRWLTEDLGDTDLDRGILRSVRGDELSARYAQSALAATFAPEITPRYRGRPVDEAGLLALADEGDSGDRLREILQTHVLDQAARHECEHDGCTNGCAVLRRVAAEVPVVIKAVREDWQSLERILSAQEDDTAISTAFPHLADGGSVMSEAELERAYREAVAMVIRGPESGSVPSARTGDPEWWTTRRDAARRVTAQSTGPGLAALISVLLLAPHVDTYRKTVLAEEKAAREHERAMQREQKRSERQERRTGHRGRFRRRQSVPLWIGLVLGVANAFGFWLFQAKKLSVTDATSIWPDSWWVLSSDILPQIQQFTVTHRPPSELIDALRPILLPADWGVGLVFPAVFLIAMFAVRRPTAFGTGARLVAGAAGVLFALHLYLTALVFVLTGLLIMLLWVGSAVVGLGVLALMLWFVVSLVNS